MIVVKIIGCESTGETYTMPRYLESSDVDFQPVPNDVMSGYVRMTLDVDRAQCFATWADAFAWWRTQGTIVPIRPDGEPNRPFTAYTVEFVALATPAETTS